MYTVTILADSRGFDTYYTNPLYDVCYGYGSTFPHLLQRALLPSGEVDVLHIPDHFRGGSVESNTIRIALTTPDMVILLNGLWETLVSKKLFLEYAKARIEAHPTLGGEALDLTYSSRALADLFLEDKLALSPSRYVERERRLVSFFRRRGRQVLIMNLPVPDRTHLNGVHYAGNYRCIPEWNECLAALNERVAPMVADYGALLFDTNRLMWDNGGPGPNLIDQWHFSPAFHKLVSQSLQTMINRASANHVPEGHVSQDYMMPGTVPSEPVLLIGTGDETSLWMRNNPKIRVEAVLADIDRDHFQGIPVVPLARAAKTSSRIVVLTTPDADQPKTETALLKTLPPDKIIILPKELAPLDNPLTRNADG